MSYKAEGALAFHSIWFAEAHQFISVASDLEFSLILNCKLKFITSS